MHIDIFDEKRVGLMLVEGNFISLPPLMPKICIHRSKTAAEFLVADQNRNFRMREHLDRLASENDS
jgi:hypothetical protein